MLPDQLNTVFITAVTTLLVSVVSAFIVRLPNHIAMRRVGNNLAGLWYSYHLTMRAGKVYMLHSTINFKKKNVFDPAVRGVLIHRKTDTDHYEINFKCYRHKGQLYVLERDNGDTYPILVMHDDSLNKIVYGFWQGEDWDHNKLSAPVIYSGTFMTQDDVISMIKSSSTYRFIDKTLLNSSITPQGF
ncbi:hypothetical protein KQI63_06515 [bacterium]|nr:hypothetical protein [bacterium]